ncbi:S-layer homology domain-containing protein [Paenibacillus silvisoli]|uniref:S-layer homology domain-containing protein n=1 Tax=Paenibacillus silvisoli TaxID=3110539 RepID=UPI0028043B6B|nr:S-layer homology domain-containing protein [Paenibacillus silvisoli]
MKRVTKIWLLMVCVAMLIPAYSVSAQESQLRSVHIYRALWKGDPGIVKPIQDGSFDFIVSTREPIHSEDSDFPKLAGATFILKAAGHPDVSATARGGFGDMGDTGWTFTVDDIGQMAAGVPYQLIPPSISTAYTWQVEAGVTVVKGGSGSSASQPNNGGNPLDYGTDIDPDYNQQGSSPFTDVPNDYWALSAIKDLADRGVLGGYPDGKFRPGKIVTRAEFAKIMMLASGVKAKKVTRSTFADLQPSDWETPFVEASKVYLNGYKLSGGKLVFKPDSPALREDIAVALVKLKGYDKTRLPDQSLIQAMFKDFNSISNFARNYVAIAIESGIASGFPDETFKPQQPVTRAQAAAMLWRAYQYGNDNKSDETEEKIEVDESGAGTVGNEADTDVPTDNGQGYAVTVRVVDAEGNPVSTGLYLKGQGRNYPVDRQDTVSGTYYFSNIPNGAYSLAFHYTSYELQSPSKVTVNNGNVKQIVLQLAVPTFTVQGSVIDAAGNPVSNKRIWLVTSTNNGSYWPKTDESGSFTLTDVAPGSYTLVVGEPQAPVASTVLEVNSGNVSGLVVQAGK